MSIGRGGFATLVVAVKHGALYTYHAFDWNVPSNTPDDREAEDDGCFTINSQTEKLEDIKPSAYENEEYAYGEGRPEIACKLCHAIICDLKEKGEFPEKMSILF